MEFILLLVLALMLATGGLAIIGSNAHRTGGSMNPVSMFAAAVAIIGAVAVFAMVADQYQRQAEVEAAVADVEAAAARAGL